MNFRIAMMAIIVFTTSGCVTVGHPVTVNTLAPTDYVVVPKNSTITIPAGSEIDYKNAVGWTTKTKKWATTTTVVTQDDGVYMTNNLAANLIKQQ